MKHAKLWICASDDPIVHAYLRFYVLPQIWSRSNYEVLFAPIRVSVPLLDSFNSEATVARIACFFRKGRCNHRHRMTPYQLSSWFIKWKRRATSACLKVGKHHMISEVAFHGPRVRILQPDGSEPWTFCIKYVTANRLDQHIRTSLSSFKQSLAICETVVLFSGIAGANIISATLTCFPTCFVAHMYGYG